LNEQSSKINGWDKAMQSKKLHDSASMLEAMQGVGTILGPIIGSSIYTAVGFKLTFYYLGGALIPLAFIINCIVKSAITRTETEEERTEPLLGSHVVVNEEGADSSEEEE
jgi:MFS family permease